MSRGNVRPLSSPSGGEPPGRDDIWERLARIEAEMAHTAKREDIADVRTLIERKEATMREDIADVRTLIERKEATMMRFLAGILTTAVIATAVALFRTFM